MHTSKPFPYRPAIVAGKHKPHAGPVALAGDDANVVRPDYDAPYRRPPGSRKPVRPASGDPQVALIQPQVAHEPAAAPRPSRTALAPSHPALPPLSEANPYGTRIRAYCPVGVALACAALIAAALLAAGIPYKTATHVAVDGWCGKWPGGLSCKQQDAGK